jgi:hypothetical protein
MNITIKSHQFIQTKDQDGKLNGSLIPIYNINEDLDCRPEQVYITTIKVNCSKGPHLHMVRRGMFTCIKGNIKLVLRIDEKYCEYFSGEKYEYCTIQVPTGVPALIINIGDEEAFVLNMPCPAWSKENPDENPVDFSDYLASNS